MAPSPRSNVRPKRGSLQKRDLVMAVQQYSPSNRVSCMSITIYKEVTKGAGLCNEKDSLTSLPLELLVMIFSHVPLDSYLDVVQASKVFREIAKKNAARLCNTVIVSYFPLEFSLIPSGMINGWIVPTHPDLDVLERYVLDKKKYIDDAMAGTSSEQESGTRDLQIKLSHPGPQYLMWLRTGKVIVKGSPVAKGGSEGKVVKINGREVVQFLKPLNSKLIATGQEDGTPREVCQRELIWHFGVPEN
ncbi:hypothetical protein V8E51_002558 [Hyaloscypha variabilis]